MRQLILDISPPQSPSLANFVVGHNAELLQMLQSMATSAMQERFVYIWGESGSGKSHLLKAFLHSMNAHQRSTAYIQAGMQQTIEPEVLENAVVAVDDVERLDEQQQIALFNLYNRMREGQGILLISGNCAPAQLGLRQDLVTRLGWGLIYQIHALSDDEKVQALKTHSQERGFVLSQEVAEYLLRHWRRDMPSLLAMLDSLDRFSLETKRPITVPLLKQVLQPANAA